MTANTKKANLCITINLLPMEYRRTKKDFTWLTDRRVVWPTVALLVAFVCLSLLKIQVMDSISTLEHQVEYVKTEVQKEKPLLDKIKERDKKLNVIAQKTNALKSIQVSKKRWVILFENISSILPPNMWLTKLTQITENEMELQGATYDFSEVAEYMVKLEKQVSIKSVSLISIAIMRAKNGNDSYNFTVKVNIKANLGLEQGDR